MKDRSRNVRVLPGLLIAVGLGSCSPESPEGPASEKPASGNAKPEWLQGSADRRLATVARHLRGFDVAMVETGYRYTELYWAGRDRNWGYAGYQLGKIELAVANGVERRPLRGPSAKVLDPAVATVRAAIAAADPEGFDRGFEALTATCNSCHVAEQVGFARVVPPRVRLSPVVGGR